MLFSKRNNQVKITRVKCIYLYIFLYCIYSILSYLTKGEVFTRSNIILCAKEKEQLSVCTRIDYPHTKVSNFSKSLGWKFSLLMMSEKLLEYRQMNILNWMGLKKRYTKVGIEYCSIIARSYILNLRFSLNSS